jgi:hypothetical protein
MDTLEFFSDGLPALVILKILVTLRNNMNEVSDFRPIFTRVVHHEDETAASPNFTVDFRIPFGRPIQPTI